MKVVNSNIENTFFKEHLTQGLKQLYICSVQCAIQLLGGMHCNTNIIRRRFVLRDLPNKRVQNMNSRFSKTRFFVIETNNKMFRKFFESDPRASLSNKSNEGSTLQYVISIILSFQKNLSIRLQRKQFLQHTLSYLIWLFIFSLTSPCFQVVWNWGLVGDLSPPPSFCNLWSKDFEILQDAFFWISSYPLQ